VLLREERTFSPKNKRGFLNRVVKKTIVQFWQIIVQKHFFGQRNGAESGFSPQMASPFFPFMQFPARLHPSPYIWRRFSSD
jgi:hypothetical protein